jgi:Carboxypeptidase regulatory-like domain
VSANAPEVFLARLKIHLILTMLALCLVSAAALRAQAEPGAISGKITGPAGAVPRAAVTIRNAATGKTTAVHPGSDGAYRAADLAPGRYEISVAAPGFNTKTATLTLAAGEARTLDFALEPALTLGSLGFPAAETQGSGKEQALLNKRSRMLQIHQKLGLITAIPMAAAVISGLHAGRRATTTGRDLHMALGSATAGLYFATAYYAIFAPKVPGVESRGPIRLHRALAWIHGPGMILTPILGAMADAQLNKGERVHGIAKYHGIVAIVTAAAYGLALLSVTKPSWIPGLGRGNSSSHSARAREKDATARGAGTDWMRQTALEGGAQ